MRACGKLIFLVAVGVVAVGVVGGQGPGGFGKGKGGGDYFSLANNGQVKAELKLTEEQIAKLPAAALKALAEILDENQMKRLKQIALQQKGNSAFLETAVKNELKLTDAQVAKIKGAIDTQ